MVFGVNEAGPFEKTETLPATEYPALGTYEVCAEVDQWTTTTEATFMVLAVPLPPPPPPPAATLPPSPVVTPPAIPATVSKPLTAAQKLHAALAKCKHQKNKRKRVKCERTAKAVARHH